MKLWALVPELVLGGACLLAVPVAGFVRGRGRILPGAIVGAALVLAIASTWRMIGWEPVEVMQGVYAVDGFGHVFKLLVLSGALIALMPLLAYFRNRPAQLPHAPVALAFSTLGAVGLASSVDLALVLLFVQMMSMASYVLVAMVRRDGAGQEAGLKLFIYGAAALAMLGYGLSFVYGLGGSLDMRALGAALGAADTPWLAVAVVLVLAGLGFEITLVPFHPWAPDVYQGATAPVSGFVSVVPKIGGFAALLRFVLHVLPGERAGWPLLLAVAAALTMTLGNLAALTQTRLKRLLAYSSIAQAGYVVMAVAVLERSDSALSAVGYYLASFALMNLGAFAVAALVERARGSDAIEALRGLGRRHPFVTAVLVLSMLSLAGIPPLAGFAGKVLLLEAALEGGMAWLAVVAAVNMVVALAYYVRVAVAPLKADLVERAPLPSRGFALPLAITGAGTLALGIAPGPLLELLEVTHRLLH